MNKKDELKSKLLELKGDDKYSSWLSKVTPQLFKETLELWKPFVRKVTQEQLDTTSHLYERFYKSVEMYSERSPNTENHLVPLNKINLLNYFVGFTLHRIDSLNSVEIDAYIKFRRNREIQSVIENPPIFNSTNVYSNLGELWNNKATTELIKEVFEPLYLTLVKGINADWLGVMEHSFPTRLEENKK